MLSKFLLLCNKVEHIVLSFIHIIQTLHSCYSYKKNQDLNQKKKRNQDLENQYQDRTMGQFMEKDINIKLILHTAE